MTAGVPIYLVSACSSAEEFVAAFRRYADRTGVFVPMAQPLPAGKRGTIALTLIDGGVMIDGEAEIIASSPKPSPLHGRPGMTVRFLEPDDASKATLGELEKARLAMRPGPPNATARPTAIPASPRPTPPAPSGRIDAANALAECVAIGDLSTLRDIADPSAAAKQKFVVPSIPAMSGRTKPQSTAPPISTSRTATTLGVGPLPKPVEEPAVVAATASRDDSTQPIVSRGAAPPELVATARGTGPEPAGPAVRRATAEMPRRPTPPAPLPVPRPPASVTLPDGALPRGQTSSVEVDLGEQTDMSPIPGETRTAVGPPPTPLDLEDAPTQSRPVIDPADPKLAEPSVVVASPSAGGPAATVGEAEPVMRASEIMAAIPHGDWTMTPGDVAPTVLPPVAPPSDNWTMTRDEGAPTGWSAASPVVTPPTPPPPPPMPAPRPPIVPAAPKTGNPVMAVASTQPLFTDGSEDRPTIVEPKIEIDPTLMEPLREMPAEDDAAAQVATPAAHAALGTMPALGVIPTPAPGMIPTPPPGVMVAPPPLESYVQPRMMTAPPYRDDRGSQPGLDAMAAQRRRRGLVIALSAASAVTVGVIAVIFATRGGAATKTKPIDAAVASAPIDAAQVAVVVPKPDATVDAGAPPPPEACTVTIETTPTEADIGIDGGDALGKSPGPFELPCGTEVKLSIKKARYYAVTKAVTPTAEGAKVSVKLARATFTIKVSSTPPGATITVGGRTLGITPTMIKLPAFEAAAITLSKPGYSADAGKLTPKANNAAYHVTLKKVPLLR